MLLASLAADAELLAQLRDRESVAPCHYAKLDRFFHRGRGSAEQTPQSVN
jgi:hypothetical protein